MIDSSLSIILSLPLYAEQYTKKGLSDILFSVHHVDVVRAKEVFEVRQIPQACLVSPGVFRIIPLEIPWTLWIWLESV